MEARTTPEAVVPFTSAQQPTLYTSTDGPSISLLTCIVTCLFGKLELLRVESPNTSLHTIVKLYCLRTHDLIIRPFNIPTIPETLEYTLIYILSNKLLYRKKKINQFIYYNVRDAPLRFTCSSALRFASKLYYGHKRTS